MTPDRAALLSSLVALALTATECVDKRFEAYEARRMYEMKAASAETCWTEYAADEPLEDET